MQPQYRRLVRSPGIFLEICSERVCQNSYLSVVWLLTIKRYKAMHVDLFRDKTNVLKVRDCQGEGIYMRFSGDRQNEIFYLGAIPHGMKAEQAMDIIFQDLRKLEEGISAFYLPTNQCENFYGGIMTFYGTPSPFIIIL